MLKASQIFIFLFLGKSSFSYFCSDCCLDINANFDFSASEDQITFDEIRDELTHSYDIPYLSIEQVASQFGAVRFQASATTPLFASSIVQQL